MLNQTMSNMILQVTDKISPENIIKSEAIPSSWIKYQRIEIADRHQLPITSQQNCLSNKQRT